MGNHRFLASVLLVTALWSFYHQETTFSQDITTFHLQEATSFFKRLAHDARNPVIVAMAEESLSKLKQKETTQTSETNNPADTVELRDLPPAVETPAIVQSSLKMPVPSLFTSLAFSAVETTAPAMHTASESTAMKTVAVEIPLLLQLNNSLVVPTLLNQEIMGTFMVDTGSTHTVITPRMAHKLGIQITPDTPRIPIITAKGYINAPLVTIKHITIGSVDVPNVEAVVQDLGNDVLLAGLLGMNYFKGMDLTVQENRLILGLRETQVGKKQ